MAFVMELCRTVRRSGTYPPRTYDPEHDSVEGLFHDVCGFLAEAELLHFKASGFGQEAWPVDVATDLPVVLEQLPELFEALATHRPGLLDFYEQGLQRRLEITRRDGEVEIECTSGTTWQPNPAVERQDYRQLVGILAAVRDQFLAALEEFAPTLSEHPWIIAWRDGTSPVTG